MAGSSSVATGTFAGRYSIEREIGRGATATVYLARDTQRGHSVAIKVLRQELAQTIGADRFLRETRISERLQHPHIVPVLDAGESDGQLYFVLPHMEEGSLRQRLQREKQLPLEDAIAITTTVARALDYAHQQGLVHRDVKPENILFTSGQACLADFGIARAIERAIDESTTSTGLVRGTPAYMSPEQASGSTEYDGRSDQYSLALVLYEMIAGVPAFIGPTPEAVIAQRFYHAPRELRVYRPKAGKAIETVIFRALSLAPADRFPSMAAFCDALLSAASLPQDEAASRGLKRSAAAFARRRPLLIAGTVLAVGVAAYAVSRPPERPGGVPPSIPPGDPRRIAVLYFQNLSPDALSAHVVDGLTEDLIDELGGVRALHVISPAGVRQFRETTLPVDSIGRATGAGTIVDGSATRSGDTLRVAVRLTEAASGRQLHSQEIRARWTELLSLQTRLAEHIAFELRKRLGDAVALRERRGQTRSLEAWESVQLASDLTRRAVDATILRHAFSLELFLRADSLYARAESLDAGWSLPTVRRGRVTLAIAVRPTKPPNGMDSAAFAALAPMQRRALWARRALPFAEAALAKDPASDEALVLRADARFALMNAGEPGADTLAALVERDVLRAIQTRPTNASAWATLAQLARTQGRYAEASNASEMAFEADSYFEVPRILSVGFFSALHAGEIDLARRWCRMGQDRYHGDPRFTECTLTLLGWTGRTRGEAGDAWRMIGAIERRDTLGTLAATWAYRRHMVAAILARAGLRDSARSLMRQVQQAQEADPVRRGSVMSEAWVHQLLGDHRGALRRLEDYLRQSPQARRQVVNHPWFRELASDSLFVAITRMR